MNAKDRTALIDFVASTREVIDWIVNNARQLFPDRFADEQTSLLLRAAWEAAKPDLDRLNDAIRSQEHDAKLDAHGLSGPQLAFKLAVFRRIFEPFQRRVIRPRPTFLRPKTPRVWRWVLRWTSWLLRCIDDIFESLVDATGIGGAIEEIKGILERILEGEDLAEAQLAEE